MLSATALSATPLHAFNGITFPLAVLAVLGVARMRRRIPAARLVTALALAAATIPANAYLLSIAHQYTARPRATRTSSPGTSAPRSTTCAVIPTTAAC